MGNQLKRKLLGCNWLKMVLISCVFLNGISAKAQYQSVLSDTNQYWNVYKVQYALGLELYADSLYLDKKIQFNNHQYTEVRSLRTNYMTSPQPLCFLREDTTTGRLWHLTDTFGFGYEHLVYDFTLAIGDTFDLPANGNIRFVVTSRDTISGKQKMVLKSINDTMQIWYPFLPRQFYAIDTLVFIEGTGSSKGIDNHLFKSISTGDGYSLLLCHFRNNVQLFQHQLADSLPFLGQCDTISPPGMVGLNQWFSAKESITIYPNPVSNVIKLRTKIDVNEILILDVKGMSILKLDAFKRNWNVSELNSGIYFFKIKDKNGVVYVEKFVIN
ncbi:MAG: T9SS C-terminal target domain-containing protein [Bacteroidetes bacterium]|nr:MAG: T9SS C-terminal target domain-containing protein [Bacteroidota bacterium]MBL1144929.1 T9SS C-terminal target domain-containing protein [Bacteroidota bacterium]NOG57723.1 T9SS type A sorting domain-containing protein [Bacteroidota bacterium]